MDPLSAGFALAASLGYGAYLRQQPTTETVQNDRETVSDQRTRQRHRKLFISKPDLDVFQGLSGTQAVMLANKRAINDLPPRWQDSPGYLKWRRKNAAMYRKALRRYNVDGGDNYKEEAEQKIYDRVYKPHFGAAVGATVDYYLKGLLASTQRFANSIASGRSGHTYNTAKEQAPVLVRKVGTGRFAPIENYIDDSPFTYYQRGIFMPNPPYTKSGASGKYMFKQNAGEGPWVSPTRMAPTRYERPGNVTHNKDGMGVRANKRVFHS